MVRLIHRNRLKNKDDFDRLFLLCNANPNRKIINKGLVMRSDIMLALYMKSIGGQSEINLHIAIGTYASEYPITVLIND